MSTLCRLVYTLCEFCVGRSHDNSKFASSGGDRSVFLWDVTAGVTTRRLPGHMGKINVVEFNEDSTVLASGECTPKAFPQAHVSQHFQRILRRDRQTLGPPVCACRRFTLNSAPKE